LKLFVFSISLFLLFLSPFHAQVFDQPPNANSGFFSLNTAEIFKNKKEEDSERIQVPKKTLLVISSKGGYGHTAAANTLQKLLDDKYNLHVIHPIDQLHIWGIPSGEQFYNMMLKNGWIRSTNFIVRHFVPGLFRSRQHKLEKIIRANIEAYQPDLVISLIPFVNYPASEAARKKEIPYLLITTDNDLRNWICGLEKLKHPHFKVTIGADLPTTRDVLRRAHIPDSAIETIGLPLRPEFIGLKDKTKIRQEFNIPFDKPAVLIMMGGAGGKCAYDYARKIANLPLNLHLIIVCGRNTSLKRNLEKLRLHEGNSITVLGFTDKVADLMAVADLIITKPGPGTINEAIAMQLPVLIDNTDISLFWERANTDMVVNFGIGQKVRSFNEIQKMLRFYLTETGARERIEKSFTSVPPNLFHEQIQEIVDRMVSWREETIAAESLFLN
jgi:processive 1,2-diacylglycerol beta-glucosyltransferase